LTSVHGVEQTPPNSRKKIPRVSSTRKASQPNPPNTTGKCSTCSEAFNNAQDFYEHLDDCVLGAVQQQHEDYVDEAQSKDLSKDSEVESVWRKHQISVKDVDVSASTKESPLEVSSEEDCDHADDDDEEPDELPTASTDAKAKPRGLTHSKGGVLLRSRSHKRRKDYPSSWGTSNMNDKLKKRVVNTYEPLRLYGSKESANSAELSQAALDSTKEIIDAESSKVDGIVIAGVGEWMS
jgi:hypothetical protein